MTELLEKEAQQEGVVASQENPPAQAGVAKSAAEVSRQAKKRSMRRMPVIVIVTLVVTLGAGTAVGGPVLFDKFIVPALYDAVVLEVGESIPASNAPCYKETLGITDLVDLQDLPGADAAYLSAVTEPFKEDFEGLVNVVRPGHEKGVVLDGCTWVLTDEVKPLITTWGAGEQSYSGVYLYVGRAQDSELLAGTPKDIEVYADGQLVGTAPLNESKEATYQRVEFSRPVDASNLAIRVLSVYPGQLDSEIYGDSSFDLSQVTPY